MQCTAEPYTQRAVHTAGIRERLRLLSPDIYGTLPLIYLLSERIKTLKAIGNKAHILASSRVRLPQTSPHKGDMMDLLELPPDIISSIIALAVAVASGQIIDFLWLRQVNRMR